MMLPFFEANTGWEAPETFPNLSGERELWIDYETDGLDIHTNKPVGLSIATKDASWYFPTGHSGGNMDESQVQRFARDTFKGKTLTGSWMKFDTHMSRNWGVPLESCELRDIQHQACLLDETRRKSGLDLLAQEYLQQGKLELPFDLSVVNMRNVHASQVGPYAMRDTMLTRDLDFAMRPLIAKEELDDVLGLENSIILPVVEMEFNGMPLDMELLHQWRIEVREALYLAQRELNLHAGFDCNPDTTEHMQRLFEKLLLAFPIDEDTGAITFGRAAIEGLHPVIDLAVNVRLLKSMLSKFLDKYWVGQRDGVLYYQLHQLRADDTGTITGRFSSAGWNGMNKGANIQQVFAVNKQPPQLKRWPVRRLMRAAPGMLWCSADARQLQYRLFADLAKNPAVMAAYAADPNTDYHNIVTDTLHAQTTSTMERVFVKNVNFALIFGAQDKKISRMIKKTLIETRQFLRIYHGMMPEIKPLIDRVEQEIRARYYESGIGYVKSRKGRRRRWHTLDRLYAGLNAHIQGTEADIMKMKLRLLYDHRKHLGITMRATVHDAAEQDVPDLDVARAIKQLLDEPTPGIETTVPIRWEVETGPNWADLKKVAA